MYENRLWGTSVARAERKHARINGYDVVQDIPYDADAANFDEELSRIGSALPAVLLQTSYSSDAILLMKGYAAKGLSPVAILGMNAGFISPAFGETLGPTAEYVLSREVWALDLAGKKPLIKDVNDLFVQRYGHNMTGNSARAFTGILVLADALDRAAGAVPEDIRNALLKTDMPGDACIMPWEGIRFDADTGQNLLGKGIIVQMLEGDYHTVWPWVYANRSVVWPMPPWSERH
jgi:branched-chain amino acid transport system substrate-binding protein